LEARCTGFEPSSNYALRSSPPAVVAFYGICFSEFNAARCHLDCIFSVKKVSQFSVKDRQTLTV
jgi:hypothetical protein